MPETKLKPFTVTYWNFIDMCKEVNEVLGFDVRGCGKHFCPDTTSYDEWRSIKGYGDTDPVGRDYGSSQIWYAEYMSEIRAGLFKEVPYMDFWHWQLDNMIEVQSNDSAAWLNLADLADPDYGIEVFAPEKEIPEWVRHIHKVWLDLYQKHADRDNQLHVWVSW